MDWPKLPSFLLLPLLFWVPAHSQSFIEDFSAGNLDQWQGETGKFTVTNGELQLNDTQGGTAALWTAAATSLQDSTTWEFFIRQEFAPSGSNFSRVYLLAVEPDLSGPVNGYYLQIGGISGSQDALALVRQDGDNTTTLLSGTAGAVGSDPSRARVRITRNTEGVWRLEADYAGGQNFQLEGEAEDATYRAGAFFGIYCEYTTTRADRIFADDIRIDPLFVDRTPPVLETAEVLSPTRLALNFDEPLDPQPASVPGNFDLQPGIGAPVASALDPQQASRILLDLGSPLTDQTAYTIRADGIADTNGNTAGTQELSFFNEEIVAPTAGTLVLTEIMADPTPSNGLPDAEYLELLNLGPKTISLGSLRLSTGGPPVLLPDSLLRSGERVILCDRRLAFEFEALGRVVGLDRFPSLTNFADIINLEGPDGSLFSISYNLGWYRDAQKALGGFSLELIDSSRELSCSGNWIASEAPLGGTPGQANTVGGIPLETEPPLLLQVSPESDQELLVRFSEGVRNGLPEDPAAYQLDPVIGITDAFLQLPEREEVLLLLDAPLQGGITYTLQLSAGLTDCLGNVSPEAQLLAFGLPEPVAPGDLLINELLFEPQVGGEDFAELYNRSQKIIDLQGMVLENTAQESGNNRQVIERSFLVFPGTYAVITDRPQDILDRYQVDRPDWLVANDLPTLGAEAGNLTLRFAGQVIDSFSYTDALHFPLLDNTRGVSLERISPEVSADQPGNWHSAAQGVGFATPTAANSQQTELPTEPAENFIRIANPRFSPDNDGFEDVLLLNYEAGRPGFVANIRILDHVGREVRYLVQNELLGLSGQFLWDGTTEDGEKARIGIYVVWSEIFDPEGNVSRQKESVVLAGRLD